MIIHLTKQKQREDSRCFPFIVFKILLEFHDPDYQSSDNQIR